MYINQEKKLMINGALQYIYLLSENKNLPLLVYIHGGPGDTALPLILHYQSELAHYYSLVVWDQRGAGKSYYEFGQYEKVDLDEYVEDLHEIVEYVLKRFNQKKVYLWAHDIGTIIGLKFIQRYPQLIQAYIGCSQVVNMKKTMRLRLHYAIENSKPSIAGKLSKIQESFDQDHWLVDLEYLNKQIMKLKGTIYEKNSNGRLRAFYLRSNKYTLFDYQRYLKGISQSTKKLWPEIMETDFEPIIDWPVPMIFIEGKKDKYISSALAKTYFDKIATDKTWYWFDASSHYPQWCEPDKFNQILIDLVQ